MAFKLKKIGIIDSGLGGITVAKALIESYPNTSIHYYADHKNLPYGNKSCEFIKSRVNEILEHLSEQGCDYFIIACHSASALLANQTLKYPWQGVVNPTKKFIENLKPQSNIGVIGTPATINSNIYQSIANQNIHALATPKLASLIENKQIQETKLEVALILKLLPKIEYLALACTHYPIIQNEFTKITPLLKIIDTPKLLVETLKNIDNSKPEFIVESSKKNNIFFEQVKDLIGAEIIT